MATTRLDEEGRITVHPALRERLGERFVQVWTEEGLLIRPVPVGLEVEDLASDVLVDDAPEH